MKVIKYLLVGLVALTFYNCNTNKSTSQSVTLAQNSQTDKRAQKGEQLEALLAKLNLTSEQEAKFNEINQKYKNELQSMKGSSQGDKQAKKQNMRAMQERKNQEVQAILTAEQYRIYLAEMEQMRSQKSGKRRF